MLRFRASRFPYAHIAAYLFYLAAAALITWPLATELSTRLIGHPFGDTYEYIHFVWWIKHALQTGQPLFFQPLLLYPHGLDLALIWSIPLQSFPAWLFALVLPLTLAYNLAALLQLALNGWAMHWLVYHLTGRARGAALIAGLIFLAYPTFQAQLAAGHTGLLALWPVPLYAYALLRLQESGARRWLALAAALFVAGMWGNVQLLIFALLPVTAWFFLGRLLARDWLSLRRLAAVLLIGGGLSLAFLIPAIRDTLNQPASIRDVGGSVMYSADLLGIVSPSYQNPLFASLDYPNRVLGREPFEGASYIGILPALLALIGLWKRRASRGWLLVALAAWLLSLGPLLKLFAAPVTTQYDGYLTSITLPWAALRGLPLLNIVRTPGRFNFTVALAVAVMAGYGSSQLSAFSLQLKRMAANSSINRRSVVGVTHASPLQANFWIGAQFFFRLLAFVITAALILLEYQFWWPKPAAVSGGTPQRGFPTVPGVIPQPLVEMAGRSDIRVVFDIPWAHPLVDKEALYLQTAHQHPILGGHVTRQTLLDAAEGTILQQTLDPALLDAAGVDVVIVHRLWDDRAGDTEAFTRQQLGRPIFQDEDYAIFTAPDPTGSPAFRAVVTPLAETGTSADSYFYTPQAGRVTFSGNLNADGRDVSLSLDGVVIQRWTVKGDMPLNVPLAVSSAGYHTVTLAVEPPCVENDDPALECRVIQMSGLQLAEN